MGFYEYRIFFAEPGTSFVLSTMVDPPRVLAFLFAYGCRLANDPFMHEALNERG